MKNCYKVKKLFGPYVCGLTSASETEIVEEHIKSCSKCALDVRLRLQIINKSNSVRPKEATFEFAEDEFIQRVYKRMASELISRRSRFTSIQRYALAPSVALLLVMAIIFGAQKVYRSNLQSAQGEGTIPSDNQVADAKIPVQQRVSIKIKSDVYKVTTPTSPRITRKVQESPKAISKKVKKDKELAVDRSTDKSDVAVETSNAPDAWTRLADADIINYSLGDHRRAIAEYWKIIEEYPNSQAAFEARNRIKLTISSEYKQRTYNFIATKSSSDKRGI